MNRTEFEHFILEHYDITPDYPWMKYPNFAAFRHIKNQKWFALVMDVPKNKLGLQGTSSISVVNLKCSPILIGSLRSEPGFFPAYHMNKDGWITVALDGSVSDEKVATVYKGNIIKNLIMDCQSYTKYRPNETTGGIFVSWRRKEELPTGA